MLALYPVLPLSPYTPPLIYSNTEISRTCDHVSILALQTLPTMSTLLRLQHRVLAVVVEVDAFQDCFRRLSTFEKPDFVGFVVVFEADCVVPLVDLVEVFTNEIDVGADAEGSTAA